MGDDVTSVITYGVSQMNPSKNLQSQSFHVNLSWYIAMQCSTPPKLLGSPVFQLEYVISFFVVIHVYRVRSIKSWPSNQ